MNSCNAVISPLEILSNSSIQHIPLFARKTAPDSTPQSPFSSYTAAAVKPAADVDFPDV